MQNSKVNQERIHDKTKLLLKFNYISSVLSLILGVLCVFLMSIEGIVPFVFFFYSGLNLINVAAFKIHGNLTTMAIYTSVLSWLSTLVITIFSGGINSPFIFILALIVLAGYVSTRVFGNIYMYFILFTIISIFILDRWNLSFITNDIPAASEDLFSLASILFAVYLLGWVFGKDLLKAHHNLYKSKAEVEQRIDEKETLLREVHHRVKNNLQTVSSLLNLQAKNTGNEQIKDLIKGIQNRVMSMAMIHEMLYCKNNLSKIEFKPYVEELTQYLVKSIEDKDRNITINIDIPDIHLGIDTAIPLGLLINEAVTNSLKYGFVDNSAGQITIGLNKEADENIYNLTITDNGIGFSKQLDFKNTKSLGLKLIHNLARQLKGSVERIHTEKGTKYAIIFQDIDSYFRPLR